MPHMQPSRIGSSANTPTLVFREVLPTQHEISRIRRLIDVSAAPTVATKAIFINDYRTLPVAVSVATMRLGRDHRMQLPDGTEVTDVQLAGTGVGRLLVGPYDAFSRLVKGDVPSVDEVTNLVAEIRDVLGVELRRVQAYLDTSPGHASLEASRYRQAPSLTLDPARRAESTHRLRRYQQVLRAFAAEADALERDAKANSEWWWAWTSGATKLRADAQDLRRVIETTVAEHPARAEST